MTGMHAAPPSDIDRMADLPEPRGMRHAARLTLKPSIPEVGDHGILLRDGPVLERRL